LNPHVSSPHWQPRSALADLPASLQDWLFDDGSLTRHLSARAKGAFSVRPLQEGWQTLREDECRALGAPVGSEGWVREVYLCGHDTPWVFARSVATREQLQASGFDLAHLGSRSLGEWLFSDAEFSRGELFASPCPDAWLPPAQQGEGLWARRSCFSRGALGVLVMEMFLAALGLHTDDHQPL